MSVPLSWSKHLPKAPSKRLLLLFSCSAMSESLWPHELQYTRLPFPSLSPRVCSNSSPLSQWCHPIISSSVAPVSSCPQCFQHQGLFHELAFHIRWPKYWSFSFSISSSNKIRGWFLLGLSGLISLLSKWLSRVFSNTTVWKPQFFGTQPALWSNSHICTWPLERP